MESVSVFVDVEKQSLFPTACTHLERLTTSFWSKTEAIAVPICNQCYVRSRVSQEDEEHESVDREICLLCSRQRGKYFEEINVSICRQCLSEQRDFVSKIENAMVSRTLIEDGYDEEPDCIIEDKLFLGSQFAACNMVTLRRLKISAILVCGKNLPMFFSSLVDSGISYHNLPIDDSIAQPLIPYLQSALDFIDHFVDGCQERVLVHCAGGISRSGSVIIAYMMKKNDWSFDKAKEYVRQRRILVNPNSRFEKELREDWEVELKK